LNARGVKEQGSSWIWRIGLGLAAVLALLGATGGPDYLKYLDWAWAFATGDIFRLQSDWGSPLGLPLQSFSHGPGLFYAFPALIYRALHPIYPFAARLLGDSLLAGWAAALFMWWALYQLIRSRTDQPLFWLSIMFLGTHLGYYSLHHGSESLSMGVLALFMRQLDPKRDWHRSDLITAAVLAAFLIILRTQLIVYVIPGMGLALYSTWKLDSRHPVARNRFAVTAVLILFSCAIFQILCVNFWMTGSGLHAPQVFGNQLFQSVDFRHPQLPAVLFHPWHGLLPYHPFYALGVWALVRRILHAPSRRQRVFWIVLIAAMAAHLLLYAAWYCWWLGIGTFGMRGLAVWGVILPVVLLVDFNAPQTSTRIKKGYAYGAILCALWSLLLLHQGDTNFVTATQLLTAQWTTLTSPTALGNLLPAGGLVLIACLRHQRAQSGSRLEDATTWGLVYLVLSWLFQAALEKQGLASEPLRLAGNAVLFLFAMTGALTPAHNHQAPPQRYSAAPCAIALMVFLVIQILFVVLLRQTDRYLSRAVPPARTFNHTASIYFPEVLECREEYRRVPGFEEPKRRLHLFLVQKGYEIEVSNDWKKARKSFQRLEK
jgi:hypothetical protein